MYSYETKPLVESWQSKQTIQYPTNEFEIQALIQHAYQHGSTIIRVIGSGHSYDRAIYDEQDMNTEQKLTIVSLENYHGVTIEKKNNVAIVKGGTINFNESICMTSRTKKTKQSSIFYCKQIENIDHLF